MSKYCSSYNIANIAKKKLLREKPFKFSNCSLCGAVSYIIVIKSKLKKILHNTAKGFINSQ